MNLRKIFGFVSFIIMAVIVIAALKLINWLPMAIEKETMRQYQSIEEVRAKLKIRDIYIPSYFPQHFEWPPSMILAQKKPFTAVITEFRHTGKDEVALVISQSDASASFVPDKKIKIQNISESVSFDIKGRKALLKVGICKDDEPCSQIEWIEDKYRITVTARTTPPELVRISESMIH